MKVLATLNPDQVSAKEAAGFLRRRTTRGVVWDAAGLVAVMHVRKRGYYKLPGGGLDQGETLEQAFARECLEETGCQVKILRELGRTEEYRKDIPRWQTSYCYVAEVVGEKSAPQLEPEEVADGFEIQWEKPDRALELLKRVDKSLSQVILDRDLLILQAALATG